jgi:hypothetical protein
MAMPLSPNTTYVPGGPPAIKARDLNDFQTYICGLYNGVYSVAGQIVDGTGGAGPVARAATTALFRAEDGAGGARGIVDYLGFRTGPVIEVVDNFLGVQQKSGAQSAAYVGGNGGWYTTGTTNSSSGYGGNLPYAGGGAQKLTLSSSRTNSDYVGLYNLSPYNGLTGAASPYDVLDNSVTVFEWAFAFDSVYSNANLFMGLVAGSTLATGPASPTAGIVQAGIRYSLLGGDTSLVFISGNSGVVADPPTLITLPAANTLMRCRYEIHRSGTPFGAVARLFINGSLFSTTTMPTASTSTPCVFQFVLVSTGTGSAINMYLQYWKMFATPFGKLTAGALTSDV